MARRIGEMLAEKGCLTELQLEEALEVQKSQGGRIGEILVKKGYVTSDILHETLAEQFGMEYVDLATADIPKEAVDMVSETFARENVIFPLRFDEGKLVVATANPLDLAALDSLRFMVNIPIECVVSSPESIMEAQLKFYGIQENKMDEMLQDLTESEISVKGVEDEDGEEIDDVDAAPVIRLVQLIITEAVKQGASDIHIEPFETRLRIRYRIDGRCHEIEGPSKTLQGSIISRIKIMAGMDIANKRTPQDGGIKLQVAGKEIDLRVSCIPTSQGESIVMRILDKAAALLDLDKLGFSPDVYEQFIKIIKRPSGINLLCGPTGCGKTTTLYAALNALNKPNTKIITAEDPVEYKITGLNQCQVKSDIGFTFARIVRAMLRQAPEIILIGEIRDREVADIAIRASLTGHLVFSTIHTNGAPEALTRLRDLGVKPFLVSSSIASIMGQRLVRKICSSCKEEYRPQQATLTAAKLTEEQIEQATFYRGGGCEKCINGYKGRMGIHEFMPMDSHLRELTFTGATTEDLRKYAMSAGMRTLTQDGVFKALQGLTTLEEVFSVSKSYD